MDRLLKVTEAAEILGLSPSTVRKMFWEGRLTRVKVGRSTRIRQGDLEAIIRLGLQPTRQGKQRRYKSQEEVVEQKPSKSPDPHVRDFFCWWDKEYQRRIGEPYVFSGGKEGKLIKGLLCRYDLPRLKELALHFLDSKDPWLQKHGGFTIGVFVSQINKIVYSTRLDQSRI